MANMTISIPDAVAPRVTEALAARGNWTSDSGQTQAQAAKAVVLDFIKTVTRHYEAEKDATTAREAALAAADAALTLS